MAWVILFTRGSKAPSRSKLVNFNRARCGHEAIPATWPTVAQQEPRGSGGKHNFLVPREMPAELLR